jgi:hypothetical protein
LFILVFLGICHRECGSSPLKNGILRAQKIFQGFGFCDRFSLMSDRNALNADAAVLTHEYWIGRNSFGNVSFRFDTHPFKFTGDDKCNSSCIFGRFIAETQPRLSQEIVRLLSDRPRRLSASAASTERSSKTWRCKFGFTGAPDI